MLVNIEAPILLASPPRSGSSLLTYILKELGVFTGLTKKGDNYNRYGYFENIAISNILINILRANDLFGLNKKFQPLYLPSVPDPNVFRTKVLNIIKEQGYTEHTHWAFKDPKILLCSDVFMRSFKKAKWVIIKRDKQKLIESLLRTPFMDAYQTKIEWENFLGIYDIHIKRVMDNCDHFVVDIDQLASDINGVLKKLTMYLNIDFDVSKDYSYIFDSKVFHAKA